jgi:hypothetical protein
VVDASGRSSPARPGQALYAGQSVQAGDDEGYAAVEYPDRTRLELHAGSGVRLDARRVVCTGGTVRAEVAGGSLVLATSQGEVHAQEGQMLVSTSDGAMRVDLEEGNAEVLRTGDASAIEMGRGSYTIATPGPNAPVVRPLPTVLTRPLRRADIGNGRILRYGPNDRIEAVGPRGLCLATAKGEVRVEPLVTRKAERLALGGGLLAIGSAGRISLYDIDPFREREPIATRGNGPMALASDGSWLAWVEPKRWLLHVVPLDGTPAPAAVPLGGRGPLVIAGHRNTVAVAEPGRVRVFGPNPATYTGLPDVPTFLAAAGDHVAAATLDGALTVWRAGQEAPLHTLRHHARAVTALALSPSGTTLVAGTADGQVWLFDTARGEPTRVIRAGKRFVWGVAFHPDGDRLAVGVQNGPLAEWAVPNR